MKKFLLSLTTAIVVLTISACSKMAANDNAASNGSQSSAPQAIVGKIMMSVSQGGSTIYSDSQVGSNLNLKAGQQVAIDLSLLNAPPGTTFSLESTQIDVVSGAKNSVPLSLGTNTFTVPGQGDYAWKLVANAPGFQTLAQNYVAAVQCANPSFTAGSLNPAGISVSLGDAQNMYVYSAASVISGANGQPPYTCAWDPTGTGIQDTAFGSCSSATAYDNYVGSRNIGVMVKDSCNTTFTVSGTVNLPYAEPSMPGNVFIFGQVSDATAAAFNDSRVNNVTYLATNADGNEIVQPNYAKGVFTIYAQQNYGMPSSVKFGMQIQVSGITDSINVASGTGSVSAANAVIASVSYLTDQNGDASPAVSYSGSNCTLSNQGAQVKFTAGQPCTQGTSGNNNMATVEVWGHYVCTTLSNSGGTINITGDFDGYQNLVDNCVGGGGGGGGIVPIQL